VGTVDVAGGGGFWATTIDTVEPGVACEFPAGLWLTTVPAGAELVVVVLEATENPADSSVARATASVCPVTDGTVFRGGPVDTNTSIAVPGGSGSPAKGEVLLTSPAGTEVSVTC
jgi:hypothetical protein